MDYSKLVTISFVSYTMDFIDFPKFWGLVYVAVEREALPSGFVMEILMF